MRRLHPAVYVVLGLLALVPPALRGLAWLRAPRPWQSDPALAEAGAKLFQHEWTPHDPLANGGDGLGPVYNASSCVACHSQGGMGGSGGLSANVTTFTLSVPGGQLEGVIHARAINPGYQESESSIRLGSNPVPIKVSQRNTPPLFGAALIDAIPDRAIIATQRREWLRWGRPAERDVNVPVGRALVRNGRVGHFGWKAQSGSLAEFVQAACANELGLGNPGQAQPTPLGQPGYQPPGLDLTLEQCNQLTAFVASLPRPVERLPEEPALRGRALAGKKLFHDTGCANCHTPDVGSVEGLYSDLLLHPMGDTLQGGGSYNSPSQPILPDTSPGDGPSPDEWRTPPLWGVADSGPYLHDGRAGTLEQAILLHGGQGARSAQHFQKLSQAQQAQLVAFLKTLRAP
jgi:CxxC motif-containing protein (DUF1111 family)